MKIFEEYQQIAHQKGFLFEGNLDNKTLIATTDRILNSKYCSLVKNNIVYFASDSYAAKAGMSNTFSGVYTSISNVFFNFEAEITKHFWFDFIAGKKRVKTNDSFLDKNLAIRTNNVEQLLRIIDVRIIDNYLKLWEKYAPIQIVVGTNYLPLVDLFKDKLVIGVELKEWIMPDKFETTFNDLQNIVTEMNHRFNRIVYQE